MSGEIKSDDIKSESNDLSEEMQLVIFNLSKEQYGLPITKVQDINRIMPITAMPSVPDFVEGIINLRGKIIPVVDLRKRLALPVNDYTGDTRIIVVQIHKEHVGIIVDSVAEVARISSKNIEPPPATFAGDVDVRHVLGVGKRADSLITILNIDHIMTDQEVADIRQMA